MAFPGLKQTGRSLTLPLKLLPPERDGVWERPAQPGDRSGTRINPKAILQGHALRLVALFPNTAALRGQCQDAPDQAFRDPPSALLTIFCASLTMACR